VPLDREPAEGEPEAARIAHPEGPAREDQPRRALGRVREVSPRRRRDAADRAVAIREADDERAAADGAVVREDRRRRPACDPDRPEHGSDHRHRVLARNPGSDEQHHLCRRALESGTRHRGRAHRSPDCVLVGGEPHPHLEGLRPDLERRDLKHAVRKLQGGCQL